MTGPNCRIKSYKGGRPIDLKGQFMISIIIPLFNERDNVVQYPTDLFPVMDRIALEYNETFEYLMVDDGSRDDTVERLNEIAGQRGDVIVLRHEKNSGMGTAIRTGIAKAKGDLIVTMDSDLTFRPQDVQVLIEAYRKTGADCVSGSPYLRKGLMGEVTPLRLLMSRSVNFLYRLLLGGNISCVSPIFRLYKRRIFDEIPVTSNNFEINAEIISKLLIAKMNVVEVPVPLLKRRHGSSKIRITKEIRNYLWLLYRIFRTKYLHQEWV
ncbi:MAG: Glycosyltransferase AglD [Methanoregula sp. PtaU1.Bin051]|nr:MAG: Glycosyltransferase AglD [Methanoregula sp. PtaU1.Bin051]